MRQQLAPPRDEGMFKSLCLAIFREHWNVPDAQLYGRRGHSQHGVDFFGCDERGKMRGGQTKLREPHKKLSEREVAEEIEKAKGFQPKLNSYVIVITGKRDPRLQTLAARKTEEHKKTGLFEVSIFSWDDIWVKSQVSCQILMA